MAIHALKYGIATRNCGLVFTKGLDLHGCNVMYAYADSNFQPPRSTGGHTIMMNGAAIVNTSKKHSTVDVSTTAAELTELFNCALDIKQVRNISEEVGSPTVLVSSQALMSLWTSFTTSMLPCLGRAESRQSADYPSERGLSDRTLLPAPLLVCGHHGG